MYGVGLGMGRLLQRRDRKGRGCFVRLEGVGEELSCSPFSLIPLGCFAVPGLCSLFSCTLTLVSFPWFLVLLLAPHHGLTCLPFCLFYCFVWKGLPIFPAHIRMRPVSRGNWRCSLVGGATCGKTPFPGQLLIRTRCPYTSWNASRRMKAQQGGTLNTRASFGKFCRFHIQLDK